MSTCCVWLAAVLAIAESGPETTASRPSLAQVVEKVPVERRASPFPAVIDILPLEVEGGGGWNSVLGDRYTASEAFNGEFPTEFVSGLKRYLERAGFEVASRPSALQVQVRITEFNGRRRGGFVVRAFGGDMMGALLVTFGDKRLADRNLSATIDYKSRSEAIERFEADYSIDITNFETVLYGRLSLQFFAAIADTLNRSETLVLNAAEPATAKPSPLPAWRVKGRLTITSEPSGAEVDLDGKLVGSTPVGPLNLPVGDHEIRLRHSGYQEWTRTVAVLEDSNQQINAPLERIPDSPTKGN